MNSLKSSLAIAALLTFPMAVSAENTTTNPRVKLSTTMGDIVVELDAEKAPITVKNFVSYVEDGFYDGLVFHRVMPNFMIQAGGFNVEMDKKTEGMKPPIKLESKNGLSNVKYSIAMARNPLPDSASCQFFINVANNKRLDGTSAGKDGYAVFGKVVEGKDVVDKIRMTDCISHPKYPAPGTVTPKVPVVINKATILGGKVEESKADESKLGESKKPETKDAVKESGE